MPISLHYASNRYAVLIVFQGIDAGGAVRRALRFLF
jgi:hypothetical protein